MKERISFWIPEGHRWIHSAIEEVRQRAAEQGVKLSEADVILACLEEGLGNYKHRAAKPERSRPKSRKRRHLSISEDAQWVVTTLDHLVETKQEIGLPASFSRELFRLASNALLKELVGVELDRKLLGKIDADSTEDV